MNKIINKIKNEKVTIISFILAVVSMSFVRPDKEYLSYVNMKTILTLFVLMFIVAIIKGMNIFAVLGTKLVQRVNNVKYIVLILTMLCFFSSMIITNDVALITFVPFTIEVLIMINCENLLIITIVLETIAANIGSSITPIGNPQNIYLYSLSNMALFDFFKLMLPYAVVTLILLTIIILIKIKNKKAVLDIEVPKIKSINIVKSFLDIDYFLLLTFIFLFIFIGNISRAPSINSFLQKIIKGREIIISILSSQVISNVPAAILLSKFSNDYTSLILGTNIGGLGTLIASMASLISYKFYAKIKSCDTKKYILVFTGYNILFLIVLLVIPFK